MQEKVALYAHAGSGNHGCEALANTICKLVKRPVRLVTNSVAEDEKYSIALDNAISGLKMLEQRGWERDIATAQLHELGIGLGQKIDGIYLTHDKYKELLEYKLMYEDLCK